MRVAIYFEFHENTDPEMIDEFIYLKLMPKFEVYKNLAVSHEHEPYIPLLTELDEYYVPHSLRRMMKAFVVFTVEDSWAYKRG